MTNEILLQKIELVVDKLMNLGGSDYEKDKTVVQADTKLGIVQRDFGIEEWDWPQGVGLYGLYKLQKYYSDHRYMEFFQNWYSRNLEVGLPSKNINTTAPYLALVLLLDQLEPSSQLKQLCREHADWLVHELPKTKEEGFQHTVTAIGNRDGVHLHNGQLWIDTLFMAVLFLNQAGRKFNLLSGSMKLNTRFCSISSICLTNIPACSSTAGVSNAMIISAVSSGAAAIPGSPMVSSITWKLARIRLARVSGNFWLIRIKLRSMPWFHSRQLPVFGIQSCRTGPAMKRYPDRPQLPQVL